MYILYILYIYIYYACTALLYCVPAVSVFQTESWDVDQVCVWLEAIATEQNRGTAVHPDDLRAG